MQFFPVDCTSCSLNLSWSHNDGRWCASALSRVHRVRPWESHRTRGICPVIRRVHRPFTSHGVRGGRVMYNEDPTHIREGCGQVDAFGRLAELEVDMIKGDGARIRMRALVTLYPALMGEHVAPTRHLSVHECLRYFPTWMCLRGFWTSDLSWGRPVSWRKLRNI
jgi:hypothetical protein